MADKPQGERSSLVYLDRSAPREDSTRARRRIAACLSAAKEIRGIEPRISREMGVDVDYGYDSIVWSQTHNRWELRDVLDLITVVYRHYAKGPGGERTARVWAKLVDQIFAEEGLNYTVDEFGGVHFNVDAEFAHNVASAVQGLGAARYANARNEFEAAKHAFAKAQPDGKQAIRSTFTAVEGVYKLIFSDAPKLDANDAARRLDPVIQRAYSGDPTGLRAPSVRVPGVGRPRTQLPP